VKHHVIRGVVTDVLGADIWWGDEDEDEVVRLGHDGIRQGDKAEVNTARRNSGKGGVGGKNKRNVPKAIIEEGCIVRCFSFVSHSICVT
jgi:hypothetical protein